MSQFTVQHTVTRCDICCQTDYEDEVFFNESDWEAQHNIHICDECNSEGWSAIHVEDAKTDPDCIQLNLVLSKNTEWVAVQYSESEEKYIKCQPFVKR